MAKRKDKSKAAAAIALLLIVLATSVVFAAGPGGPPGAMGGGPGGVQMSESVIRVKLTAPETGSLLRETEFIGKIEPAETVNVYPEVSEKVTGIYFEAGDTVKAGDLLFEMDDSDAQLDYQQQQLSYERTQLTNDSTLGSSHEKNLNDLKNSLDRAQQSLNEARTALREYNDGEDDSLTRAQKQLDLAEQKRDTAEQKLEADPDNVDLQEALNQAEQEYLEWRDTVNELENTDDSQLRSLRNAYRSAQLSYQSALDNYNYAAGISYEDTQASAENTMKSAELSLERSAKALGKYKVYAPIDGVIESASVSLHEAPGAQSAAYTISNKDNMTVRFNATADAAAALSIGDAITVAKGGDSYTAYIYEIDTKADAASGLFPIKAQVEGNDGRLLSGVSVKVTAATAKAENALLIPIDTVYYEDNQAYVFTYQDGRAVRTNIETGLSSSETVAVESGLDPSSRIITTWHPDLKDGAEVLLQEGQQAAAPDGAQTGPQEQEVAAK